MTTIERRFEEIQIVSATKNWSEKAIVNITIAHHLNGKITVQTPSTDGLVFNCSLEKAQNISRALNAGLKYAKKSLEIEE